MRIFLAIRHSRDPKQYFGDLWAQNFVPALQAMGHEVIEARTNLLSASKFMDIPGDFTPQEIAERGRLTEAQLAELKAAHAEKPIKLFLSYFYNSHFDPAAFAEIEKLGITCVNFYCNSIYQFNLVSDIAAKVQWSWHAERDARDYYLKVGGRPVWVQMAADPNVYRPIPVERRQQNACFLGSRYADRDRWLAALVDRQIPLAILGPGWCGAAAASSADNATGTPVYLGRPRPVPGTRESYWAKVKQQFRNLGPLAAPMRLWHQYQFRRQTRQIAQRLAPLAQPGVPPERICEVFAQHEVILNFSNVWADGEVGSPLIPHVRLRDFEAPMCRTCYLTGYTDEIAEFYKLGDEIDTYRTADELADKIRFYLKEPAKAEALREAGYQRARRDHTWVKRFEQLFRETGLA